MTGRLPRTSGEFDGTERFQVVRMLGRGGMGTVYEVVDQTHNARVALKAMHTVHPHALLRFKNEFRALADLAHPNLVSLYELHVDESVPFFTMELVRGVDFVSYLRQGKPGVPVEAAESEAFTPKRKLKPQLTPSAPIPHHPHPHHPLDLATLRGVLRQLVVGVQALHDAGKLHRDLKPSNVLVTHTGRVVILDFGLVADINQVGQLTTDTDLLVGTAEYMSPEQAMCSELTTASDWYAVGTMLYEVLTERLPFTGGQLKMLCDKQQLDPPYPTRVFADSQSESPDFNLGSGEFTHLTSGELLEESTFGEFARLAMDLLSRNPLERPTGTQLLERLGATASPLGSGVASRRATQAQLFGRESHLSALIEAFANTQAGQPEIVHVRGQSGMGKSTVVQCAVDEITSDGETGVVVLSGRCYEQESVPYKAIDSIIDALSRYLRGLTKDKVARLVPMNVDALLRVFPVLRRVEAIGAAQHLGVEISDPHELRRRAFGALRDLLTRIAMRSPLIVWIDDLQWGDVDSGMLLGELLRPPDPPPFLLIVSYRSEADVDVGCLAALQRVEGAVGGAKTSTIEVGALVDEDATKLARALFRSDTPVASNVLPGLVIAETERAIESIVRESVGNPFLLAELVRFKQSGAGLRRSMSGRVHLEDMIEARLSQFSDSARLLVELVAVAGRPIALKVVVAAGELSPEAGQEAVAQLRAAQVVRTARVREQAALDTFHDRIRETVVRLLPDEVLKHRHVRLVRAIEASNSPDPETLARHCLGAGQRERAAVFAERAGEQAVGTLAFDRAAEWFQKAIEWGAVDVTASDLRRRLAEALANAGRGAESGREFLRAADDVVGNQQTALRQRAAAELLSSGRMDEGIVVVKGVLTSIGARYPATQALAMLLFVFTSIVLRIRGYRFRIVSADTLRPYDLHRIDTFSTCEMGLIFTDTIRGRYFSNRALLAALWVGEPNRAFLALSHTVMNLGAVGYSAMPRIQRIEAQLDELERKLASPQVTARRKFACGFSRYLLGQFLEGYQLLDAACDGFLELAGVTTWERDSARIFAVSALWSLGRLRDLTTRVADYREDAVRRGDNYMLAFLSIGYANTWWLAADRPEDAIREATTVFDRWPQVASDLQHYYALLACVQAELYRGNGREAFERTHAAWPRMKRGFLLHIQFVRLSALHLRGRSAIAAMEDKSTAQSMYAEAQKCVQALWREQFPCAAAMAKSLAASLKVHDGAPAEAISLYGEASSLFDTQSMALYAAACRYRQGEVLGGESGAALIAGAEALMQKEAIVNPKRMVDLLVPLPMPKR